MTFFAKDLKQYILFLDPDLQDLNLFSQSEVFIGKKRPILFVLIRSDMIFSTGDLIQYPLAIVFRDIDIVKGQWHNDDNV